MSAAVAENQPAHRPRNENRMTNTLPFLQYSERLQEFIARSSVPGAPEASTLDDAMFEQFARELFSLQFKSIAPFRLWCEARGVTPARLAGWREIPAVPTAAFKEFDLTSLPPEQRSVVFYSSGTTMHRPSRHFHNRQSLEVYEASLLPWFHTHFLADLSSASGARPSGGGAPHRLKPGLQSENAPRTFRLPMIFLTPPASGAPHSSLVYMFEAVRREFAEAGSIFAGFVDDTGAWNLNLEEFLRVLRSFEQTNRPVALLGTAFLFVHALDWLEHNGIRLALPEGSRVLETGGYKGRSRTLTKPELYALIQEFLGIAPERIVSEYGMSELSSQAYDHAPAAAPTGLDRIFRFPPWARVQIVSPETGDEVANGEPGLVRVCDLANVASVLAVQTEDIGIRRERGFEWIGRAAHVEPRGCSLMTR